MKHKIFKEKNISNIMIFGLIFLNLLYAKEGTLSPYKSSNLRLTLMRDLSIRFIDPKEYKGRRKDSLLKIDSKNMKLLIGGDKPICKVDENSPIVSTCVDKVRYIDWKVIGEDGQWKFLTDNNLCLTAGTYDKKTRGYFVNAFKCDQRLSNQKFRFTPEPERETRRLNDEDETTNDKPDPQRMKSIANLEPKDSNKNSENDSDDPFNERHKGDINAFQRDIGRSDDDATVLLALIDNNGKKKHYKTTSPEMKKFLTGNNSKLMNHDFIVDSWINADFIKA